MRYWAGISAYDAPPHVHNLFRECVEEHMHMQDQRVTGTQYPDDPAIESFGKAMRQYKQDYRNRRHYSSAVQDLLNTLKMQSLDYSNPLFIYYETVYKVKKESNYFL
jgi:hypothetical protein